METGPNLSRNSFHIGLKILLHSNINACVLAVTRVIKLGMKFSTYAIMLMLKIFWILENFILDFQIMNGQFVFASATEGRTPKGDILLLIVI